MRRVASPALLFALLFVPALSAREPVKKAGSLEGLDDFISEVMGEWHVPGLALAVVQDGKVILLKGYGYRDVEKKLPVTPKTVFAIASISKSFTATGLGMLADDKKLDWDHPVRDYLPDLRLHAKVEDDKVTPRDLVCHRTGLPRHDALWFTTKLTRPELYARLRHLEPSKKLRYAYQYNNLMFMTAGLIAERVSGKSWEDFTRARILEPLGMKRTYFSVNDSQKADDCAQPYEDQRGKVERVPFRNIDPMCAGGGINSCVEDMIRYVQFHLSKGKHEGERLLSVKNAEEMQAPQMVIPLDVQKQMGRFIEPGDASYGLGLMVSRHRGEKMIEHGGSLDGFLASLSFLPNKNVGLIVLTNLNGRVGVPVTAIVRHEIYDRLLGLPSMDWKDRGRQTRKLAVERREKEKKKSADDRKKNTSPSHALADHAGTFEHPAHGKVAIEVDGKNLKLIFSGTTVVASHYHYDTFEIQDLPEYPGRMLEDRKLTFHVGAKGQIDRVGIRLEPAVPEFVFRRIEKEDGKK